jgi:hypothetical protein
MLLAGVAIIGPAGPAAATPFGQAGSALLEVTNDTLVVEVARRGGARAGGARVRGGAAVRRGAVVGPRGGAAVRRGAVVRPGVVRPGVARPGRWVRPGNYWWRPGGAIAAGAAIGFVTAATAAAWAGPAPGPNMCWYYTDPSRRQGFWDVCQ